MTQKRLALDKDGNITWCTASDENVGKGRCTHLTHQMKNEGSIAFCKRIEREYPNVKIKNNYNDGNAGNNKNNVENKKNITSGVAKKIVNYSMRKLLSGELAEHAIPLENKLHEYASFVATMEFKIKKLYEDRENYGIQWYQHEYMKLDSKRRDLHNDAIGALCGLNRICLNNDLPLVYPGNPNEDYRGDVAESIFNFYTDMEYM